MTTRAIKRLRMPVLTLLVAAIAAAGVAYASIPDTAGVIHGCYAKRDGSLRVIDPSAGGTCSASKEIALDWNQTGPPGPPGPSAGFYAAHRDQVQLDPTSHDTTIVSITDLPAGSYLIQGHTAAVNPPTGNQWQGYVRCGIKAAGADSAGTSHFPASATSLAPASGWSVGQVFTSIAVTSSTPFTAELYCYQTVISTAYVEESRLMAVQLGSITTSGDSPG